MTMSKKVESALIALGIAVFILIGGTADDVLPQHPHVCVDLSHIECDGECGCDGLECPK